MPTSSQLPGELSLIVGELAAVKVLFGALISSHPDPAGLQALYSQASEHMISNMLALSSVNDALNNAAQDLSKDFSRLIENAVQKTQPSGA